MGTLSTLALGIAGSFVAWLLVAQIIKPHLKLSKEIEMRRSLDKNRPDRYYIRIRNKSWLCKVFDVNLYGKVKIRGLYPDQPADIKVYSLKVGEGMIPYINPHRGNTDNVKRLVIKTMFPGKNQRGQLKKLYREYHNGDVPAYVGLKEIFEISDDLDIEVEISVISTHIFSGARSITTQVYRKENLIEALSDTAVIEEGIIDAEIVDTEV